MGYLRHRVPFVADRLLWAMEDRDELVRLGALTELRKVLDELEYRYVDDARRAGRTWAQIGTTTGISKQGAHQRATRPTRAVRRRL